VYRVGVARLVAALAVVTALALAGAAAGSPQKRLGFSPATILANGAKYVDPAGDSGFVPDIVSVEATNDNEGKIELGIGFANRTEGLTLDDVIQVPLDADGAFYTGHNGFEYMLQVSAYGVEMLVDAGGTYTFDDARVGATFANGVLTLELDFRDVDDTAALRFYVAADSLSPSPGVYDWAPDGDALYRYTVDVPLLVDKWDGLPTARAGLTWALTGLVTTDDVQRGTISCAATLGGRRLPGTGRWTAMPLQPPSPPTPDIAMPGPYAYKATVACNFKLSKTARRKTLKGTVTLTKNGVTVRRAFSVRVH
jgi:hypothetical protein